MMEPKASAAELIASLLSLTLSEEEEAKAADELDVICPDPEWSDYIYLSDEFVDGDGTVDVSKIVDRIFAYKPIALLPR